MWVLNSWKPKWSNPFEDLEDYEQAMLYGIGVVALVMIVLLGWLVWTFVPPVVRFIINNRVALTILFLIGMAWTTTNRCK